MVASFGGEGAKRRHRFPLIRRQGEAPLHFSFQEGAFTLSGRFGTGHFAGNGGADIGVLAGTTNSRAKAKAASVKLTLCLCTLIVYAHSSWVSLLVFHWSTILQSRRAGNSTEAPEHRVALPTSP